jgi:hypothetical protein
VNIFKLKKFNILFSLSQFFLSINIFYFFFFFYKHVFIIQDNASYNALFSSMCITYLDYIYPLPLLSLFPLPTLTGSKEFPFYFCIFFCFFLNLDFTYGRKMYYLSLSLTLSKMMISRSIHFPASDIIFFLFMDE